MFISTHNFAYVYSIIFNFDKVMPYKCNHLVNFYIFLDKRKKSQYLCNTVTNLPQIWHDDACFKCAAH